MSADPGPEGLVIRLRDARVSGLLGVEIDRSESALHLQRLGFDTAERPDGLDVTVPHWRRNDVTREADLIEEVARLHGVNDQLPATLPSRRGAVGVLSAAQRLRRRAEDALAGRGLLEIVGWSFESPSLDDRLRLPADDPRRARVVIENPMSSDQSVLRTTLLGSLLGVASHNAARGQGVPGIFESGAVYLASGEQLPHEHRAIGALVPGRRVRRQGLRRGAAARAARRGDVRRGRDSGGRCREPARWSATPRSRARRRDPSRSCTRAAARSVWVADRVVGWVGDVHPLVAGAWDLADVAAFEVNLDALIAAADGRRALRGPDVVPRAARGHRGRRRRRRARRDRPRLRARAGGKLLVRAEVFDVYRGEQIAAGRTSLAIALTFRAKDRTLTDADVARVREKIVARLGTGARG